MKKKVLKIKGIRTPRPFLFIHGFVNGRMKTAAVDSESGNLNSAYIHGKIYLFDELCHKRVLELDRDLSEVRAEAETLVLELNTMDVPSLSGPTPADQRNAGTNASDNVSSAQNRRAAAASAERYNKAAACQKELHDNALARRTWILRRLIKIREQITLAEHVCIEELGATADALRNCFCAYGHGALLTPITPNCLPPIGYQKFLDNYHADYEVLKKKISAAIEEEAA